MKDHEPPIPSRDHEGAVVESAPEDTRFLDAVKLGEDALDRGEFLTHEQAGKRLERFLQPR